MSNGARREQEVGRTPLALVVEDDADAAEVAAGMLRLLGVLSRTATDGHQALQMVQEMRPHLILLDVCLPEMDGITLMQVAQRFVDIEAVPVIGVSAVYRSDGTEVQLLHSAGVCAFLPKPFNLEQLRSTLAEAAPELTLKRGRPVAVPVNAPPSRRRPRLRTRASVSFDQGSLVGILTWEEGRSTAVVERFVGDDLIIRTTEDEPPVSMMVRLRLVYGASRTEVRILGVAERVRPAPPGARVRLLVKMATPHDAWLELRDHLGTLDDG